MIQSQKNCFLLRLSATCLLSLQIFQQANKTEMAFYFVHLFFRLLFSSFTNGDNSQRYAGDKENVKPNKWHNFWTELEKPPFGVRNLEKKAPKIS